MQSAAKEKQSGYFLIAMLSLVYFSSYMTRYDYTAVLSQIVASESILKSQAALATTACFITYGLGQVVSGYLGDRIDPKKLITAGLLTSAAMNILLSFSHSVLAMTAIWAANGLAQAMLWPPLVRILAQNLDRKMYARGTLTVSLTSSGAVVLLYLSAPAIIRLCQWRGLFRIAAGLGLTVAVLWLILMSSYEKRHRRAISKQQADASTGTVAQPETQDSLSALILQGGLIFAMVGIVCQGTLRDGVTTWLPSYLNEVFQLGTGNSIFSSVVLPIASMLFFIAATRLDRRMHGDEIRLSTILFLAAAVCSLLMGLFFHTGAWISIALAALITGCMHGINLMLICNLPGHFSNHPRISFISGLLNSCTYVGSALSAYGFAIVAECYGWRSTVFCWTIICLFGAVSCIVARKKIHRFLHS